MSMLLLVRDGEDLPAALKSPGAALAYQRRAHEEPGNASEVLGVWVRRDLDAALPAWACGGPESGGADRRSASTARQTNVGVAVVESLGLLGVWVLCRFGGPALTSASTAAERRRVLVDSLVNVAAGSPSRRGAGTFFPVFPAVDSHASIHADVCELRDRHPHLVGGTWSLHDRVRGLLPGEGVRH